MELRGSMAPELLIGAVAIFFAAMGLFALAWPDRVLGLFGVRDLGIDARNEVRAVYGGFGLAIAGLLVATLFDPAWAPGAILTVALALYGMAAGRVISLVLDGVPGLHPWLYFVVEIALGSALLAALPSD